MSRNIYLVSSIRTQDFDYPEESKHWNGMASRYKKSRKNQGCNGETLFQRTRRNALLFGITLLTGKQSRYRIHPLDLIFARRIGETR